jgi:hypothetical protein
MTEHEWLVCNDPAKMLQFLRSRVSDRKCRLYLCGGCRQLSHLFFRAESLAAVEVAERYSDENATQEELKQGAWHAEALTFGYEFEREGFSFSHPIKAGVVPRLIEMGVLPAGTLPGSEWQVGDAIKNRLMAAADIAYYCAIHAPKSVERWLAQKRHEVTWPGRWLIDCVFGNPFRPVVLNPAWLTPEVFALAQAIYDDRVFDRMSELADALEEAGCTSADMLAHCRAPGPHARGCWVVDQILGKE